MAIAAPKKTLKNLKKPTKPKRRPLRESPRPKKRPEEVDLTPMAEAGDQDHVKKKMKGGYMKKKPVAMKGGGSLKMVEKNGEKVPFYAADGVGKMSYGGKAKKMRMGGKCRGMGAATKGGNYRMG
jgi:hypothetical protein